jgi:ATP-dependent Zn protease
MAIDVAMTRERQRQRRLKRLAWVLGPLVAWLWFRIATGNPVSPGLPHLGADAMIWLPALAIVVLLGAVLVVPMLANARSPHVTYLPEQIDIGFSDVKGLGPVVAEVRHTLQVFLNHKRFTTEMGGTPRRGVLFEGPPGTGKTHVAKTMAKEAGVPFLFISSTSFQSMWYGMTARRIKAYFRQLRKTARREGGAIGFIEEFDAIGVKRGGMGSGFSATATTAAATTVNPSISEGVGGVVNELLVQMQSFDDPPFPTRFGNWIRDRVNRFLPSHRQFQAKVAPHANILLIGATNRADSLDPALLRPGRFDRILHFDVPGRRARRELVDYFLTTKRHEPSLDDDAPRDDIAAATMGYSPAALERLFDEALGVALRSGRKALTVEDVRKARFEVEIGLPQPVEYPDEEKATIAVHESGHAVVAYLVGKGRKLEVLSIIKRRDALGLLAHSDEEERFTQRHSEMRAMIEIALGGMVAEELFFGESGTGPSGDLAAATNVVADMVGSFGLGDSLISLRAVDPGLAGGNLTARVLADDKARKAADRILEDAKAHVTGLLTRYRYLVEALRNALLAREELIEGEILNVIRAAEMEALADGRQIVDLRESKTSIGPRPIELVDET